MLPFYKTSCRFATQLDKQAGPPSGGIVQDNRGDCRPDWHLEDHLFPDVILLSERN